MHFLLLICATIAGVVAYVVRAHGLVYVGHTMGGLTTVHDDTRTVGERIRVLSVASTCQSATYLDERWAEPVFVYHRLFDHVFDAWPRGDGPQTVAVLGGGGYAVPKHLVAHHPEITCIHAVEIDPAIEQLARRFFFLDRLEERFAAESTDRLCLHVADAHGWLEACDLRFDAIINDCFLGFDPERSFMTREGALLLHERLTPGGVYLSNVVSSLEGPQAQALYEAIDALSGAFAHVWVYPCSANEPDHVDNNVVVATDRDCTFTDGWEWPTAE